MRMISKLNNLLASFAPRFLPVAVRTKKTVIQHSASEKALQNFGTGFRENTSGFFRP
jgi:hypothetical protein